MAKTSASDQLKERIRLLEIRQAGELDDLRGQWHETTMSLKPANLLKSIFGNSDTSKSWINAAIDSSMGIVGGYLTHLLIKKTTKNILMRILGVFLQLAVTNLISKNAESLRTGTAEWINKLMNKIFKHSAPAEAK